MAETITKPIIAPEILESLQVKIEEEQQVIVHCCFPASPVWGNLIRIWHSAVLIDKNSGHQSTLMHAENITVFPYWTQVPFMQDYWFTLIFSGLPKSCTVFDFKEIIPEEGGFYVPAIIRNTSDIYRIKIE